MNNDRGREDEEAGFLIEGATPIWGMHLSVPLILLIFFYWTEQPGWKIGSLLSRTIIVSFFCLFSLLPYLQCSLTGRAFYRFRLEKGGLHAIKSIGDSRFVAYEDIESITTLNKGRGKLLRPYIRIEVKNGGSPIDVASWWGGASRFIAELKRRVGDLPVQHPSTT